VPFTLASPREQNKVFKPTAKRAVVLATNVAETSLTVPGVKYVIDPGLARISRYSPRTRCSAPIRKNLPRQRRPAQRPLRPRSEGICIRLYSQEISICAPNTPNRKSGATNLPASFSK